MRERMATPLLFDIFAIDAIDCAASPAPFSTLMMTLSVFAAFHDIFIDADEDIYISPIIASQHYELPA
jgi:hypothetical protein